MTSSRIAQITRSVRTARDMTLGLVADVPPEQWTFQPLPGVNHVAWCLLHLLLAEDWGPTALGDPRRLWGDRYGSLVAQGPIADPAAYPDAATVLNGLRQTHERFLALLEGVSDADLDRPTSGAISQFAPDLGTLLYSHVWHEGFHGGQIAVVRKALGLPPKFG